MRVLIVDDDADFRRWLRATLASDARFEVVGEAINGVEAVDLGRELTPDLVLMDISMPVMNGLAATAKIKASCPSATVVIVSGLNDGVPEADEAAGATGRIKKSEFTVPALVEVLDR